MKYIRTKDRVFKAREEFCKGYYDKFGNPVFFEDVIKQSDTIEELMDGFWWEDDFYKAPIFISNYQFVLDRVQNWVESDKKLSTTEFARINIYASIYAKGKGWLHVAKMKGILPNGEIDWELCYV